MSDASFVRLVKGEITSAEWVRGLRAQTRKAEGAKVKIAEIAEAMGDDPVLAIWTATRDTGGPYLSTHWIAAFLGKLEAQGWNLAKAPKPDTVEICQACGRDANDSTGSRSSSPRPKPGSRLARMSDDMSDPRWAAGYEKGWNEGRIDGHYDIVALLEAEIGEAPERMYALAESIIQNMGPKR